LGEVTQGVWGPAGETPFLERGHLLEGGLKRRNPFWCPPKSGAFYCGPGNIGGFDEGQPPLGAEI